MLETSSDSNPMSVRAYQPITWQRSALSRSSDSSCWGMGTGLGSSAEGKGGGSKQH